MADPKSTKLTDRARKAAFVRNGSMTPEQRFWSKVEKTDGCWGWQGQRNHKGYGEISINNRWFKAHRYSWALHFGEIPAGRQVCHTCDNRACVRPDHLFVGTNSDNQRDAAKKGRAPSSKISAQDVRSIRGLLDLRVRMSEIAFRFGVSVAAVQRIKSRKAYAYVE